MNNIVNMVKYYLLHKNADDSIVLYLKQKIDKSNIEDLIIIQIELLYTDPTDKLVETLVNYINNKINDILRNIELYDLTSLICTLKYKVDTFKNTILLLNDKNTEIFNKIKEKDLNKDGIFDNKDSEVASKLINETQDNIFTINKLNSEIKSINIWLNNLDNSLMKKIKNSSLNILLENYIKELSLINRDDYINNYIKELSNKIDDIILNSDLIDSITNIIPELDKLYNNNSNKKNKLYKLLDYYIDLLNSNIKRDILNLDYEEKIILKEKLNTICYDILHNDTSSDDFKVQVINSYFIYL